MLKDDMQNVGYFLYPARVVCSLLYTNFTCADKYNLYSQMVSTAHDVFNHDLALQILGLVVVKNFICS